MLESSESCCDWTDASQAGLPAHNQTCTCCKTSRVLFNLSDDWVSFRSTWVTLAQGGCVVFKSHTREGSVLVFFFFSFYDFRIWYSSEASASQWTARAPSAYRDTHAQQHEWVVWCIHIKNYCTLVLVFRQHKLSGLTLPFSACGRQSFGDAISDKKMNSIEQNRYFRRLACSRYSI